jgi:neopullulanase
MTYPGAPSIYYGDEIGMTGGHDPANRGAFPWHQKESWDTELLHEFQRLIALRRQRPSLRRGTFHFLWSTRGVVAFARKLEAELTIVVLNAGRQRRSLDLPVGSLLPEGTVLSECWSHNSLQVQRAMLHDVIIQPRSGRVLISS